jgi:hypothetical protein
MEVREEGGGDEGAEGGVGGNEVLWQWRGEGVEAPLRMGLMNNQYDGCGINERATAMP